MAGTVCAIGGSFASIKTESYLCPLDSKDAFCNPLILGNLGRFLGDLSDMSDMFFVLILRLMAHFSPGAYAHACIVEETRCLSSLPNVS